MWCSFCLEVFIIYFSFGKVSNVLYQCSHSASFLTSSSMVVPLLPIALLPLTGPGRTASIQGFWKAAPLAKAVTMSLRMTLATSKFNLLTKAVKTSMYHISSSVWSDGMMGLVNLTTNAVVGTSWVTASIGLASWSVGQSFVLGSVERTVAFPSSRGPEGARQGMPNIIHSRQGNWFNWWGLLRWRSK